jgi:serine/threonine protein kinase
MPAFRYGMKCFFEEGRALAKLSHPNVIRVLNFFRANDTVYMVMEYEQGAPCRNSSRRTARSRSSPRTSCATCSPSAQRPARGAHAQAAASRPQAVEHLHAQRRHAGADRFRRRPADAGLRHADAQADVHAGLRLAGTLHPARKLGPWSDIYSVGASMYACIARLGPAGGRQRQEKDSLVPAMVRWEGKYSDQLLETIDWCLCLNHLYRPQSVFALQKALTEPVKTPPSPRSKNPAPGSASPRRQAQEERDQ